jgi:hypothetical protein
VLMDRFIEMCVELSELEASKSDVMLCEQVFGVKFTHLH